MRKQQKIWNQEHKIQATLPSLEHDKVSSFVLLFIEYLKKQKVKLSGRVVDIGSGMGRNAIYLARVGFDVHALEYIEHAVKYTGGQARKENLEGRVHCHPIDIDKKWPFPDNYFDFAIDCFSSIDIETKKGRETYMNEMLRTLKPNGYIMVSVVSVNDELEGELMKKHPGKEKNSVYWPANGKFQKNYDEAELREFYHEFDILELKEITKPTFKLGKSYNATNFLVIIRKPL